MFRPGYERSGGPLPSRGGLYERYAGGDFGVGYKDYGSGGGMGPYPGESALGFSGYYGRGYDHGSYRAGESFRGYGMGSEPGIYGGGYGVPDVGGFEGSGQFALGGGFGGVGGYGAASGSGGGGSSGSGFHGSRGSYGGGAGGRYHPYGR